MSKNRVSIPDPMPSIQGLMTSVLALKQTVEVMAGLRGGDHAIRCYVQNTQPEDPRVGDRWINPDTDIETYWAGTEWRQPL